MKKALYVIIVLITTFLLLFYLAPWEKDFNKYGSLNSWINTVLTILSVIVLLCTLHSQMIVQKEQQKISLYESERFKSEIRPIFSYGLRNFRSDPYISDLFVNRKFQIVIENVGSYRALNIEFKNVENGPWQLGQQFINAIVPGYQHILGVTYHQKVEKHLERNDQPAFYFTLTCEDLNRNKYTQTLSYGFIDETGPMIIGSPLLEIL